MIPTEQVAHDLAIAKITAMLNQYRSLNQNKSESEQPFTEDQLDLQMIRLYKKEMSTLKVLCEEEL